MSMSMSMNLQRRSGLRFSPSPSPRLLASCGSKEWSNQRLRTVQCTQHVWRYLGQTETARVETSS